MKSDFLTDEEVAVELERLKTSKAVILARKEQGIKNRKRQYMYQLRNYEKRGKQLIAEGYTLENIEQRMYGDSLEDDENI